MCEFISAVKGKSKSSKDKWYFLTYDMVYNTPRGEILRKEFPGEDDIWGHTAIRDYFQLREGEGENWECTDFSTPDNFPAIIAKAIKRGDMRYGHLDFSQLLTPKALEEVKATADWRKANADWEKAYAKISWELFSNPKNRVGAWQEEELIKEIAVKQ